MAVRHPEVAALLDALTAELAGSGYTDEESFGYSPEELEHSAVHLVGAWAGGRLVGVGGVELQDENVGELKRFFVAREHRGGGVADVVLDALVAYARENDVRRLRLETGDKRLAAIAFYRRCGFVEVPRFGPYTRSATSMCMQRDLS